MPDTRAEFDCAEADSVSHAGAEQNSVTAAPETASRIESGSSTEFTADPKPAGTEIRFHRRSLLRRSTRRLVVIFLVVLFLRVFVGEASMVPTASMEGTILVGDHLLMNKLLYGPEIPLFRWRLPMLKTIHRGEIVVFHFPKDPAEIYLKRVAAVGGDRVEIRDGVLYVNLQPVNEPYARHRGSMYSAHEEMQPLMVPPGQLFVMGDNRDNSSDSRDWGFVPVRNVIGEPLMVYWSYDAPSSRWLDENLGHRLAFYASIAGNFFSRTRWKRMGTIL
jgi:signal peptidase I